MSDITPEKTITNPFSFKSGKLSIHLEKLNAALKTYDLKIDGVEDIQVKKPISESEGNETVLIIFCQTIADTDWFNGGDTWFFKEAPEMVKKLEELEEVKAVDFDRGDKVLTIVLAPKYKNVEINKELAQGGAVDDDAEIGQIVDAQFAAKPDELLAAVGEPPFIDEADKVKRYPDIKKKAIAIYKNHQASAKPVKVFFRGKKMNLGAGPTTQTQPLQKALMEAFTDFAMGNLNGGNNPQFMQDYASTKTIVAMDNLMGRAMQANVPVFYIDDTVFGSVVDQLTKS